MSNDIATILGFIDSLREAKIYYSIRYTREDSISIDVSVPGQRWEIDFLGDGTVDVEIFKSDGCIYDRSKLIELFQKFSD